MNLLHGGVTPPCPGPWRAPGEHRRPRPRRLARHARQPAPDPTLEDADGRGGGLRDRGGRPPPADRGQGRGSRPPRGRAAPPLVPRRVSGPLPAGRPPLHRRRDVLVDGRRAGGAVVEGGVTKKAAPASDGGPGTPWRGRSSGPAAPCSVNRLVTIAKQLLGNLDEPRRRHP